MSNLLTIPQLKKMALTRKVEGRFVAMHFVLLVFGIFTTLQGFALQPEIALNILSSTAASKGKQNEGRKHAAINEPSAKPEKNAYDYSLPRADGESVPLSSYKGKYILIVNLGRKSSYNNQLPALIKLNDTYKDKGLVVIGVPSDDFGAAEPGTSLEIQKAYADAKVDFLVTGVSKITGEEELPIYLYLTKSKNAPAGGPVHWNYTKFIVDKKGNVIARLNPDVAPDSPEMLSTIDQILDGRYKPKKEDSKPGAAAAESDDGDGN